MNTMLTRTAGLTALLCAVALTLAGCVAGPPPPAAPENVAPAGTVTEYVGTLDGVDPAAASAQPGAYFLAIAVDGAGAVTGYMCDGSNFGDGTPETFSGRLAGDRLDLTSDTGGATLTATRSGSTIAGQVRLGDRTSPFTLTQAQGVGGLYLVTRAGDVPRGESERGNRF
ncbi:MAG: hypothetical protein L0H84_07610, partial [Pseudonocardia sp.]|nr:hypothetical protein [Pseudonocardia sp.]